MEKSNIMRNNEVAIWKGPNGVSLPSTITTPQEIVEFANNTILSVKQQQQIIGAFNLQAFDMGAEYAWRRAMAVLKKSIASLGMKFVGEMLGRDDITEFSSPERSLTDYTAITLAEQLGVVGKTGALKLRQSLELLNHFFSNREEDKEEELNQLDALQIVRSCIQYILGEDQVSVALEFTQLRNRLNTESIDAKDGQILALTSSALFYIRTVLNILLTNIKTMQGAGLEHSLANINLILPLIWDKIAEKDKWHVGTVYRDVVAEGKNTATNGMKKALIKVKGFDFVPESLRSNTFIQAAKTLIDTHFAFDNYYNEPAAVRHLASLGSVIPAPALQNCMDAYLLVCLGNIYGVSTKGAELAKNELMKISQERWQHFFDVILGKDEYVLSSLQTENQIKRFANLLKESGNDRIQIFKHDNVKQLYSSIIKKDYTTAKEISTHMLDELRGH